MHPGEPELEVGVPVGHEDWLQVIVHIILIILTVFFRIYFKRWCTQESQSRRWEYLESSGTAFRKL